MSSTAGPHCLTATKAACFADSPDGAAIAAAQLLVRTFAFSGPGVYGPTIANQVTGTYQPMLARVTAFAYKQAAAIARIHDQRPIETTGGWISGYAPVQTTPTRATIDVLIVQGTDVDDQASEFTSFAVHLVWLDGDWRLIAPDYGDWSNAATAVPTPDPSQYLSYDDPGAGGAAS